MVHDTHHLTCKWCASLVTVVMPSWFTHLLPLGWKSFKCTLFEYSKNVVTYNLDTWCFKCCELPTWLSPILFVSKYAQQRVPTNIFHNQRMRMSRRMVGCKCTSHASNIKTSHPYNVYGWFNSNNFGPTTSGSSNVIPMSKTPPKDNIWNTCDCKGLSRVHPLQMWHL